jgi:lactate dehydrogenase-like 2-hydroxyacid dehydrogenase
MTADVVLVTDYAWPRLDIERELLHPVGVRVVVGSGLAPEAVAVMTNLSNALAAGTIRGAAVDVLPVEPAPAGWLRDRPANLVVTPHAAYYSVESVTDLQRRTAAGVKQCLAGELPPNVVNPAVLDSPRLRLDRR